jgi:uncharacterized protein
VTYPPLEGGSNSSARKNAQMNSGRGDADTPHRFIRVAANESASPSRGEADSLWRVAALSMMRLDELRDLLAADPREAAPWVHAAASAGLIEGQLRLGRMLLAGEGVAKDEASAFAWFARAAEAGDADARNMLGRCYEHGWGVETDSERAAHCYAIAACAGHAWAQYNLGHMFLDGIGVPRDREEAFAWYMRAAEQGHERAMNLVACCHEEGWGTTQDGDAARAWYKKSAEGAYFRGCYNYATILAAEGRITCAILWFKRALASAPPATRENILSALARSDEPALRALATPLDENAGSSEGLV